MDADQPPKPEDPDYTAAQHKRPGADSESSTSPEGSLHSTRTLQSQDFQFVTENGRIYANNTYFLPCDQAEQDRLAIQHQVFLHALKGKLTNTPITPLTRRILDLGTGPGDWAVAMARQYPHIEVVGIDLAVWDIETTEGDSGGDRVTWELDDLDVWDVPSDIDDVSSRLERYDPFNDPTHSNPTASPARAKRKEPHSEPLSEPQTPSASEPEASFDPSILESEAQPCWNFSQPFDLIHMRNMKGAFASWEEVYAEIYKNLRPGGYIEVADYEVVLPEMTNEDDEPNDAKGKSSESAASQSDNYTLPTVRRLYLTMMQGSFKAGRPLGTFYMHPTYLEDAGFKDVRTTYVNVPVGQWHEDEEQKRIGKMFLVVLMENLESHLLRLATKYGDAERRWTADEVREQVEVCKREILDWNEGGADVRRKEWCANFKWVVGRKSKNA